MNTRPRGTSDQEIGSPPNNAQDTAQGSVEPSSAGDLPEAAASLGAEMKAAAQATSKVIRKQAATLAREVGHELRATADAQRARGADAVEALSRAILAAAGELKQQVPGTARYAREAAHSIESLSRNIRKRSASALVHSASDVARTQPMLFFAGAIATGFTLSRFLKSSAEHEHGDDAEGQDAAQEHADD